MPKSNITGGKHHKKAKKHRETNDHEIHLEHASENQIYASVKKRLGGTRLLVLCSDGKERSASIPGKFRRKVWMNTGDIILCNLGVDCDDTCCFVIYKYTNKEASILKSQGKIDFDIIQDKEDQIIPNEEEECWTSDSELDEDEEGEEGYERKIHAYGNRPLVQRKIEYPESEEEKDEDEEIEEEIEETQEESQEDYIVRNRNTTNDKVKNKLNKLIDNL